MAKQRKRHNGTRRAKTFFNQKFRVWTWEADRDSKGQSAYAQKHMGTFWREVDVPTTEAVLSRPQNWCVCIRALCWTGSGNPWIEDITFIARDLRLQDLEGEYLPRRDEVLAACQTRHVVDCGWLAQTFSGQVPADKDNWSMIKVGDVTRERMGRWQDFNSVGIAA